MGQTFTLISTHSFIENVEQVKHTNSITVYWVLTQFLSLASCYSKIVKAKVIIKVKKLKCTFAVALLRIFTRKAPLAFTARLWFKFIDLFFIDYFFILDHGVNAYYYYYYETHVVHHIFFTLLPTLVSAGGMFLSSFRSDALLLKYSQHSPLWRTHLVSVNYRHQAELAYDKQGI